MSLPPLSKSQKAAVEHPFADALVTAGAGSGKTRVLSERFVHLVRGGHAPLRRLAALTFTEKAAAQMRDRIADLLRRLGDEQLRADVEFAPISTIHAFCALLLRQHAIEAGVDPAFEVLDETEAGLLREDAALLAENRLEEEASEALDVLALLGGAARESVLGLIAQLRGAGTGIDELEWMDAGGDERAAIAAVEEALEAFAGTEVHLDQSWHEAHADARAATRDALTQLRVDGDEVTPFLVAGAHAAVAALPGRGKKPYTAPYKALKDALAHLRGVLLDHWGAAVLLPALRTVLATYDAAYTALKEERSALDFTDLELRARDVLERASVAQRPLDLAPHGLLVDEFQDTNPLQARILELLRAAAPQFSVGDPKQSIYGFRGADVGVILHERARLPADALHAMNTSYRACPELVAGINALNARLFADDAAGVTYEALDAGATYLPATVPTLEVALIDAGKGADVTAARGDEAAWIANRIAELVEGQTSRLAIAPKDTAADPDVSVGPVRYGDIALLFRAGSSLPIYEAALEARGIPFLTQKSAGFFRAEEIQDLIYVLRVVHNPGDRFALACVATGPVMGAGDAEILRWFAPGDTPAWDRLVAEAEAGGRHAGAVRTLQTLREEAVCSSLARAVDRAIHDLGLLEFALLRPGGDRCAANLRKAVEIARRLDQSGRRGLGDLLRHLQTLRDREVGESEAPIGGEADDVVRLTTVHGAKGLEYPIVFVPDIGRSARDGAPVIRFDGEHRIAARVRDPLEGTNHPPAGYEALGARSKARGAQEELRLLYVAMTRAEERLILSGSCKGVTAKGTPSYFGGWGAALWDVLGVPLEAGTHAVTFPDDPPAEVRVHVVEGASIERPEPPAPPAAAPVVAEAERAAAREILAAADRSAAPLGDTRYVVSVSELLTFAASPQRYYTDCVLRAGARAAVSAEWDRSAPAGADESAEVGPEAGRRAERAEAWDEGDDVAAGLDRAAVGRAVHAVIERLRPEDEVPPPDLVAAMAEDEGGSEALRAAVGEMAERFTSSSLGADLRKALATGADVRREVDFHARIRFPGGDEVADFDSLLVKGSIDLWLPTAGGIRLVDHKTNRAGALFRTPQDLARHYAWQLRLYTLAAERLLGEDVAAAGLVLLDPGWGADAVEVPIDISGEMLEETRRLCRAFALAELQGRYPEDWRTLLG